MDKDTDMVIIHSNKETGEKSTSLGVQIAIQPPKLDSGCPDLWFLQLECLFALVGITEEIRKFCYVCVLLDVEHAESVADIMKNPPATDPYETLKKEFIKRLSTTQPKELLQLLGNKNLGDQKPSDFLADIRQLAGSNVTDVTLRTVWLSRMPDQIGKILSLRQSDSLEELVVLADMLKDSLNKPESNIQNMLGNMDKHLKTAVEYIKKQEAKPKQTVSLSSGNPYASPY